MAKLTIRFQQYGDPNLARHTFIDSTTFDHVSTLVSRELPTPKAFESGSFPKALVDLSTFCDLYCIRDHLCFYAPVEESGRLRFFRSAAAAFSSEATSKFADGMRSFSFLSIDDDQRARIFSRWSDLARTELASRRPEGVNLSDPEIEALMIGLMTEEMLQASVYIPGVKPARSYFEVSPDETEFCTHSLLMEALERINSGFFDRIDTRAALSLHDEPLIPPILAMILAKVSRPSEIPEELGHWREKFAPLRRRLSDVQEASVSDMGLGAFEKENRKLRKDMATFLARFEQKDPLRTTPGVNPWDLVQAGEKRSETGWSTDFSLKLSTLVKVGADAVIHALRRRRLRPLPDLESRVKRLKSVNRDLSRVFGTEWSGHDDVALRDLVIAQKQVWQRRSGRPVRSVKVSRPTIRIDPLASLFQPDSLVDEFLCRLRAGRSKVERTRAVLNIGLMALDDDDAPRGVAYVQSALAKAPKVPRGAWRDVKAQALAALARLAARAGRGDQAEAMFRDALALRRSSWVLNEYAAYLMAIDGGRALSICREAAEADPQNQTPWINLSSLLATDNLQEAIVCARRAANLSGNHTSDAWKRLGLLLMKAGDYPQAADALQEATALLPKDAELWAALASVLGAVSEDAAAAAAAAKANRLEPARYEDADWMGACAEWAQRSGDHDSAIAILKPWIRSGSAGVGALRTYGLAMEGIGDLAGARAALVQAHEREPQTPASLVLHFALEARAGEWQRALAIARSLAAAFPALASAYAMEGDALVRLDRHTAALASFGRAVDQGFKEPLKFYNLAVQRDREGDFENAIRLYQLELQSNPDYPPAYANLGADHCETGDLDAAFRCAARAVELEPLDPISLQILAQVHLIREEPAEAAALLHRVVASDAADEDLRAYAKRSLAELGDVRSSSS